MGRLNNTTFGITLSSGAKPSSTERCSKRTSGGGRAVEGRGKAVVSSVVLSVEETSGSGVDCPGGFCRAGAAGRQADNRMATSRDRALRTSMIGLDRGGLIEGSWSMRSKAGRITTA